MESGLSLLTLPEDLLEKVASYLSTKEWARSAAGASRRLRNVQLGTIQLKIPYQEKILEGLNNSGRFYSIMRWAAQRWNPCHSLELDVGDLLHEEDYASMVSLLSRQSPQRLHTLQLIADQDEYASPDEDEISVIKVAAARVFEALLSSLPCDGALDMLAMDFSVRKVPILGNLKHLHIEEFNVYVEDAALQDISGRVDHLPNLETLELTWPWISTHSVDLRLRSLHRLRFLALERIVPGALEVPRKCAVSIMVETGGEDPILETPFLQSADSGQVKIFSIDTPREFRSFQHLQNLKVLDIRLPDIPSEDVHHVFDSRVLLPFKALETFRLSAMLSLKQTLELQVPAPVVMKSLIIQADRVRFKLESPGILSAGVEELIVVSHECIDRLCKQGPAPCTVFEPVLSGNFYLLASHFGRQGFLVETARCPDHQCGFVYVVKGAPGITPSQLFRRACRCLCGGCWCCKLRGGDRDCGLYPIQWGNSS